MEEYRVLDRVFRDRYEAERALSTLVDKVNEYGFVSVSDYYTMVGLTDMVSPQTDSYGWKNLTTTKILSVNPGYKIQFPKPESLDRTCPCSETPASTSNNPFEPIAQAIQNNIDKFMSKYNDDRVNHPQHYQSKNGLEVINVIEAFTDDLTGMEAVCTGNALKYICRWKHKNGVEDLKKAVWYMNHLIDILEKENSNEQ